MPFKIIRNDITKMDTDAIVNAANSALRPGGGVCGAIFEAAGYDKLLAECRKIGFCPTGSAVITSGYDLNAKYIIHAVGPKYGHGGSLVRRQLYSSYIESLELAKEHGLRSIAFPLISSGIYGYPKAKALKVATNAITDFLTDNDMYIYLVVYDKDSFETSGKLFANVKAYIDETMVCPDLPNRHQSEMVMDMAYIEPKLMPKSIEYDGAACPSELGDILNNMDRTFSESLLSLIDKSGMTDAQVYKKANVDRRLFSKIRGDKNYKPSKITVVAFALALELELDETEDLLAKAGYSMTHSSKFDIIVEYFISHGIYEVFEINEILFAFDQSLIGV